MARKFLSTLCLQEEDYELEENATSCDFWLWKDDYIDPRSKFVIPKLLGRIAELEHIVESFEKVETSTKEVNKPIKSTKSMESRLDMNKIDSEMDNFDDDLKKMKAVEKNEKTNWPSPRKARNNFGFLCFVCKFSISKSIVSERKTIGPEGGLELGPAAGPVGGLELELAAGARVGPATGLKSEAGALEPEA
uniref:Uncharacterized protein n=1 Tax=Solanum lycopersicum TaxID=4081 RepID=A0A3Q7H8K7_SOLLC